MNAYAKIAVPATPPDSSSPSEYDLPSVDTICYQVLRRCRGNHHRVSPPKSTIWENGVGNGFLGSAQNFTVEAGAPDGMACFGSQQAHDLAGEVRHIHFSCAGTHRPNLGINNVAFMFGVTWFFGK